VRFEALYLGGETTGAIEALDMLCFISTGGCFSFVNACLAALRAICERTLASSAYTARSSATLVIEALFG